MILNESALTDPLVTAGFEVIRPENLSFSNQVRAFANAEIVVAPHGAGLANIVFCRPGTRIVEIFDPTYVVVDYWSLANEIGLPYHYVLAGGRNGGPDGRLADIVVDPTLVMAAIDRAIR